MVILNVGIRHLPMGYPPDDIDPKPERGIGVAAPQNRAKERAQKMTDSPGYRSVDTHVVRVPLQVHSEQEKKSCWHQECDRLWREGDAYRHGVRWKTGLQVAAVGR